MAAKGNSEPEILSQVAEQMEIQNSSINSLSAAIDYLEGRLVNVLSQPEDAPDKIMDEKPLVPLAKELKVNNNSIRYATERINDIVTQIEV